MPIDTHWSVYFLGGFFLASAAWFAWLSIVVGKYDRMVRVRDIIIEQNKSDILTLEAQKTPFYQVGVGVDNVARRNPAVVPLERTPIESVDELPTLYRIGEQDVWDSSIGGYRRVD